MHTVCNLTFALRLCTITLGFVFLGACGGETSSRTATPKESNVADSNSNSNNTVSMKEQLAALEKKGLLPNLDRSTNIAGPDADHNGIRDDIDAYIAALPISEQAKKAAQQRARAQQRIMLIDLKDRPVLMVLADAGMAATSCMSDVFDIGATAQERYLSRRNGAALTYKIAAITANTPERAARYMAYMRALDGTSTTLPNGNTCED